jgi:GT2 family glycosyltransferase
MISSVGVSQTSSTVGVIIVNFNADALLLRSVDSVVAQSRRPQSVIVVDNASTDTSAAAISASYPGVTLVRLDRNVGFAAANNIGVGMLDDCELIALLNPDAFADVHWLETLVAAAEAHPEIAAFASRIERADGSGLLDSAGDVYHVYGTAWPGHHGEPASSVTSAAEVFGPSGAAAFYRRQWLLRVGGFDEKYFCYFEDVDLNLRLQVAGGRCLYVPEARVRHVGGASSGGLSPFTIYHSQRNLVWTYVKSMPPHIFWRYLPMHVLLNVGSIVSYGLRGHTRTLLRAKRDAVLGLPAMVRARRSVMETSAFDRRAFDAMLRRGVLTLLRETRS